MKQLCGDPHRRRGAGVRASCRPSAESPPTRKPAPECPGAGKPESRYMGADSCCAVPHERRGFRHPSELATLDEFSTWDHRDRHRLAFEALSTPCARQMESLLDMKPGEAATSRQCIACHAIDVTADTAGPTLPDAASQHAAIAQGVSCEACHGRASLWIDRHWKRGEWSGAQTAAGGPKSTSNMG